MSLKKEISPWILKEVDREQLMAEALQFLLKSAQKWQYQVLIAGSVGAAALLGKPISPIADSGIKLYQRDIDYLISSFGDPARQKYFCDLVYAKYFTPPYMLQLSPLNQWLPNVPTDRLPIVWQPGAVSYLEAGETRIPLPNDFFNPLETETFGIKVPVLNLAASYALLHIFPLRPKDREKAASLKAAIAAKGISIQPFLEPFIQRHHLLKNQISDLQERQQWSKALGQVV